jgi:DNA-binding response OmpR family regulator
MLNILIVEDNESLNNVYNLILTKAGYKVKTAFNGIEALKAVKQKMPDLILLDMLMPQMGGLSFLKKFNAPKDTKPKIIIMSNLDEDQDIKEAQNFGVTMYILKASLSPKELILQVKQTIGES